MSSPAPLAVPIEVREQRTDKEISRVFRLAANIVPDKVTFGQILPYDRQAKVICLFSLPGDETRIRARGVVADDRQAVTFVSLDQDAKDRILSYAEERTSRT